MHAIRRLSFPSQLAVKELKGIGHQSRPTPIYIVANATVPIEDHECMTRIPTAMTAPLDMIDAVKPEAALVEQTLALDGSKRWLRFMRHPAER